MGRNGRPPSMRPKVLAVLAEIGPLTATEIAAHLGVLPQSVNSVFTNLREREQSGAARMVYVDRCIYAVGKGARIEAVWALGERGDARRIPAIERRRASDRKYRKKRRDRERLVARIESMPGNPFASLIAQVHA